MTAQKYRKKPVVIEAVQLRWSTWSEVCEFTGGTISPDNPAWNIPAEEASDTCGEVGPEFIAMNVTTTHGETAVVRHGDWIVPDSKPGTFYPVKPDVFAATYEPLAVPNVNVAHAGSIHIETLQGPPPVDLMAELEASFARAKDARRAR